MCVRGAEENTSSAFAPTRASQDPRGSRSAQVAASRPLPPSPASFQPRTPRKPAGLKRSALSHNARRQSPGPIPPWQPPLPLPRSPHRLHGSEPDSRPPAAAAAARRPPPANRRPPSPGLAHRLWRSGAAVCRRIAGQIGPVVPCAGHLKENIPQRNLAECGSAPRALPPRLLPMLGGKRELSFSRRSSQPQVMTDRKVPDSWSSTAILISQMGRQRWKLRAAESRQGRASSGVARSTH